MPDRASAHSEEGDEVVVEVEDDLLPAQPAYQRLQRRSLTSKHRMLKKFIGAWLWQCCASFGWPGLAISWVVLLNVSAWEWAAENVDWRARSEGDLK